MLRRRILYILPSIHPSTGGPARSIPLQISALAALGYEIELYTTWWPLDAECEPMFWPENVSVRVFPSTTSRLMGGKPHSKALISAVRDARGKFDMYHVCSLWNPLIDHATYLLRRAGLPYAVTCHGMLDPIVFERNRIKKRIWSQLVVRRNIEEASFLQFTSETERDKAWSSGWRLPQSIVIPISVDLSVSDKRPPRQEIEREYPILTNREVVLFVGRINWVKNLDLLIHAVTDLIRSGRDLVLLCVGPDSDDYQSSLSVLAADLGVSDRIIFTGLLRDQALLAAYARADVLALVSKKENFGQAAAEALVMGVPIVLSEGVDMGKTWTAPPVWRVNATIADIAEGLDNALRYARKTGLPSAEARTLAEREWSAPPAHGLLAAYEAVIDETHIPMVQR